MTTFRLHHRGAAFATLLALVVSGCSGSSPTVPALTPPTASLSARSPGKTAAPAFESPQGYGRVRFRIPVPGRIASRAPHRIFPAYVSASTSQVVAVVRALNQKKAGSPQTFPCTAVCTGSILAPLGVDSITLRLEDAGGKVLSQGTAAVVVFKAKNNAFNFTLDGVPASVDLTPVPGTLAVVPASQGYVLFNARDADGNIITPDGDYVDVKGHPLVFDVASSNASFQLGVTTIAGPGMPIPFSYDGTQHVGDVTLTPSAHPGVSTKIAFTSALVKLIPGIATRLTPPIPLQVQSATQVPMASTAATDPNAFFVLGTSGGQSVALAFNVVTGVYGTDFNEATGAPFQSPPIDLGAGDGFFGYLEYGKNLWAEDALYNTVGLLGGVLANPCPPPGIGHTNITPIGIDSSGLTLFCQFDGAPGFIYDATHSVIVAYGQDRKIEEIDGIDYFVTANDADGSTPGVNVYASGSATPVAGAISVGANVTSLTTGYYGGSDQTVKAIGGSTVATFSHAVEGVIGFGSSYYVYESGGIFGISSATGTFESAPLPIGAVVEVVTGVNGVPMLVETDGTLDVMAI